MKKQKWVFSGKGKWKRRRKMKRGTDEEERKHGKMEEQEPKNELMKR